MTLQEDKLRGICCGQKLIRINPADISSACKEEEDFKFVGPVFIVRFLLDSNKAKVRRII